MCVHGDDKARNFHVIESASLNDKTTRGSYNYPALVDTYLQCTIQMAYQFYLSVGFIRTNNKCIDGWELLPADLRTTLANEPHSFINYNPSNGHPPCKLMHSLQQPSVEVSDYDSLVRDGGI